jgi:hypothetical protein
VSRGDLKILPFLERIDHAAATEDFKATSAASSVITHASLIDCEVIVGRTGGTSWTPIGEVSFPVLDPRTITATPPTPYTQVTDPSLGFDSQGNVYLVTM